MRARHVWGTASVWTWPFRATPCLPLPIWQVSPRHCALDTRRNAAIVHLARGGLWICGQRKGVAHKSTGPASSSQRQFVCLETVGLQTPARSPPATVSLGGRQTSPVTAPFLRGFRQPFTGRFRNSFLAWSAMKWRKLYCEKPISPSSAPVRRMARFTVATRLPLRTISPRSGAVRFSATAAARRAASSLSQTGNQPARHPVTRLARSAFLRRHPTDRGEVNKAAVPVNLGC
jgi:hypothetical protein